MGFVKTMLRVQIKLVQAKIGAKNNPKDHYGQEEEVHNSLNPNVSQSSMSNSSTFSRSSLPIRKRKKVSHIEPLVAAAASLANSNDNVKQQEEEEEEEAHTFTGDNHQEDDNANI